MLFPGTTTTDEVVLVIERSADGATSSFVIVPWPWPSAIVAPVTLPPNCAFETPGASFDSDLRLAMMLAGALAMGLEAETAKPSRVAAIARELKTMSRRRTLDRSLVCLAEFMVMSVLDLRNHERGKADFIIS